MARPGLDYSVIAPILANLPEGVRLEHKAAWTKIQGKSDARIYVPRFKDDAKTKIVREIHLSAFGRRWVGTIVPPKKNGKVEAYLDLQDPNALVHLAEMIKLLAVLEPTGDSDRGLEVDGSSPRTEVGKRQRANSGANTTDEAKLIEMAKSRLALMRKVAAQRNVPLNKEKELELMALAGELQAEELVAAEVEVETTENV